MGDDWLTGLGDFGAGLKSTAEDLRRATAYTVSSTQSAIVNSARAPLDSQLPWYKRTWLYATDQEKAFIILALVGVAVAVFPYIKKAI